MASLTQDLLFKQAVMRYSQKHGVTKASIKYKTTRQWIYYWLKRYDGTLESLKELSRKPHSHPNQHTTEELKLISDMRKRNGKDGLVDFWVKLKKRGYTRTIPSLYRTMRKMGYYADIVKKSKYKPKPYESMQYPGQRVQIDVKYVPQVCTKAAMGEGTKLYQFTAIDEFSRQRYLEGFSDNSSFSAAIFLRHAVAYFSFKIECVQTDNGNEFTKHYSSGMNPTPTLFQKELNRQGIRHKLIRPFTPRHNGKVERSHRKDQTRFYDRHSFYSLEDFNRQLKIYNREYNNFPTRPLNWLSPNQYLKKFPLNV